MDHMTTLVLELSVFSPLVRPVGVLPPAGRQSSVSGQSLRCCRRGGRDGLLVSCHIWSCDSHAGAELTVSSGECLCVVLPSRQGECDSVWTFVHAHTHIHTCTGSHTPLRETQGGIIKESN